jgi:hypothetical protein
VTAKTERVDKSNRVTTKTERVDKSNRVTTKTERVDKSNRVTTGLGDNKQVLPNQPQTSANCVVEFETTLPAEALAEKSDYLAE